MGDIPHWLFYVKWNCERFMKEKISFCIPCYKSERTVSTVISEIIGLFDAQEQYDYEIVCVVDGSPDRVFDVIKNMAQENRRIAVAELSKNFGQASAKMAALNIADGDYYVSVDDDGQCPLDKFWELFEPLKHDKDVSIASYKKKKQSKFRNFGSKMNLFMIHTIIDGVPKEFVMSNFYVFRRFIRDEMIKYSNPYPYEEGLMIRLTERFAYVEIDERERLEGKTGYTFKKLIELWLNGFTAFSVKPLRLSSFIGFVCSFIGFCLGIITVVRKFIVTDISVGWSSIFALLLFVGGLIMLMLGMIGEYIGRIYICINKSPQYIIKEIVKYKE